MWSSTRAIVGAVDDAPARNKCSPDRAMLVAAYLAFRMKDVKGYVDDAVGQVSEAVGFDAKRALTVLNMAGVWVVVRRGNQRSSSWRAPGPLLVARGAQMYRADVGSAGGATRSAGGAQAPRALGSAGGAESSAGGAEGSAGGAQVSPSTPDPHHVPHRDLFSRDDSQGARLTSQSNGSSSDSELNPVSDAVASLLTGAAEPETARAALARGIAEGRAERRRDGP